jgi:Universal stress protein UspA and related nucleotide-binding proteins
MENKYIKNILIPVDFSKYSEKAAKEAVRIFTDSEHFNFIYVLPLYYADIWDFADIDRMNKIRKDSEEKMVNFIKSLKIPDTVKVDYAIIDGDPARNIIELANSGKFDLVVMGHSFLEMHSSFNKRPAKWKLQLNTSGNYLLL